jgi:hypothetical protein
MSANERGGLKNAFANFHRPDPDKEAELKLLGRTVGPEPVAAPPAVEASIAAAQTGAGYAVATTSLPTGLTPRPLLHREAVRQLSFRCPVTLAQELRRKAAFNQLEQQQIIVEGIKRVLLELPSPPENWQE